MHNKGEDGGPALNYGVRHFATPAKKQMMFQRRLGLTAAQHISFSAWLLLLLEMCKLRIVVGSFDFFSAAFFPKLFLPISHIR